MSILQLLASENFITVNKTLIKELGLEEAVIFGELCSEYAYWEKEGKLVDGMFFCSSSKLEDITGLSEYKQRSAIKNLIQAGYLKQELKGLPKTRYFEIIQEPVLKLFQIRTEKITEPERKSLPLSNKQIDKNRKSKNSKNIIEEQDFEFGKSKTSKPNLYSKCVAELDSRHYSKDLSRALVDYLEVRLQMKDRPLYTNSWKGLLNKLERDFEPDERIGVVFQSIERGYASFFPVSRGFKKPDNQLDKPWEQGVTSKKMTECEAVEHEAWVADCRRKGIRVDF